VGAQTSPEAVGCIKQAQKVFYLEADPLTRHWIAELNPNAESLRDSYAVGKERRTTYAEMVERVLDSVRAGNDVCFLSYGHPGVFGKPMHDAVTRARAEGYAARMLPAISSEDCLFADLGIDPASAGCQTFEATDFLIYRRNFDPCTALVLLQIGVIAERGYKDELALWNPAGLLILVETLLESYPAEHVVTVYEAATYACCDPSIQQIPLSRLPDAAITAVSTLYVPPKAAPQPNPAMLAKLGL
jgi:uncharacterized protein YabN with tetrapyrrole methylase and pyrophosphatase domain